MFRDAQSTPNTQLVYKSIEVISIFQWFSTLERWQPIKQFSNPKWVKPKNGSRPACWGIIIQGTQKLLKYLLARNNDTFPFVKILYHSVMHKKTSWNIFLETLSGFFDTKKVELSSSASFLSRLPTKTIISTIHATLSTRLREECKKPGNTIYLVRWRRKKSDFNLF